MSSVAHDRVRVTTFVAVPPRTAFDVFTRDLDAWWRHGPRYRMGTRVASVLRFDGEAGGRLVEVLADGGERVIGRVLAWEPGQRLWFEWRAVQFAAHETTEVEVTFEPGEGGTRVTLEHRGWAAIAPDHVVRHHRRGADFIAHLGRWWGDLATTYRLLASRQSPE